MNSYSIIIPTHNRQYLIKKNIEYFGAFKECSIYICDSSSCPFNFDYPANIIYKHMPDKRFEEKIYETLLDLDSNYIAMCADDDYIVESTTLLILDQLRTHKYVMGVGRYLGFHLPFSGFLPLYQESKFPTISDNAEEMVKNYLSNYYMSLWAVYRKDIILKAYEILVNSEFSNDNLIELVIAITCATNGKILFTENIYGVREINTVNNDNWAKKHKPLLESYKEGTLKDQLLSLETEYNKLFRTNLFNLGIKSYLFSQFKTSITQKIKNIIPTKLKRMIRSLPTLKKSTSEVSLFLPIVKSIQKYRNDQQ